MRYVGGKPVSIATIVVSTQHDPKLSHTQISKAIVEEIINLNSSVEARIRS